MSNTKNATKSDLQAQLAALQAQLTAAGVTTNGVTVANTDAAKPVAAPSLVDADRALIGRILAKFGKDNGFGPATGNVHWSLPKSARPEGHTGAFVIVVKSADGPVTVPATVMSLLGAKMDVSDFRLVKSASEKSEVWTSATVVKRINAAGFSFTKRSKIWQPAAGATSQRTGVRTVSPVDVDSLI